MELMPSRDGWRDFLYSGTRPMLGRHPILNVANAAKTVHTGYTASERPGKQWKSLDESDDFHCSDWYD